MKNKNKLDGNFAKGIFFGLVFWVILLIILIFIDLISNPISMVFGTENIETFLGPTISS